MIRAACVGSLVLFLGGALVSAVLARFEPPEPWAPIEQGLPDLLEAAETDQQRLPIWSGTPLSLVAEAGRLEVVPTQRELKPGDVMELRLSALSDTVDIELNSDPSARVLWRGSRGEFILERRDTAGDVVEAEVQPWVRRPEGVVVTVAQRQGAVAVWADQRYLGKLQAVSVGAVTLSGVEANQVEASVGPEDS